MPHPNCPIQDGCDRREVCNAEGGCHYTGSPFPGTCPPFFTTDPSVRPYPSLGPRKATRWDIGFLHLALSFANDMSKDPNTKVGAVLVGPGREVIQMGFNGFPTGISDTPERLNNRTVKNRLVVHAERNAICLAARRGIATQGATLYLVATDASGAIWGGPPCVACLIELIQAGVTGIITLPFKAVPSHWAADLEESRELIRECNHIQYREVELPLDLNKGSFW